MDETKSGTLRDGYGLVSERTSILLTKALIAAMAAISGVMLAAGPGIVRIVMARNFPLPADRSLFVLFLVIGYVLGFLLLACLFCLWRIVGRIGAGVLFVPENVRDLERLERIVGAASVGCLAAGLAGVRMMVLVGIMACLMTLVIRVIRGAFRRAVLMQEELDLTV